MSGLLLAFCTAAAAAGASSRLVRSIDDVVRRPAFARAIWGIEVRSFADGRVLYARDAGTNLKPASTLKLLATAAALDAFGPEDRVETTVESAGRLDASGRLLGDVYLVGRGDASLSAGSEDGRPTAALEVLAGALWSAGVRRIEGRLVGHEGAFQGERRGDDWSWGDLVWCYGAEVSALSFNDNCAELAVAPGERVGDSVRVEVVPKSRYVSVVSSATTSSAGSRDDLSLSRDLGGNVVRLSGTKALGGGPTVLNVAVEDPGRYAATLFGEALEARGIPVAGPIVVSSDPLPADVRVLATHRAEPLAKDIATINKESQNLHTEILIRRLGLRSAQRGTTEAGIDAVRAFLAKAGIAGEMLGLRDGSGLSRSDLVAAHDLVQLLSYMARHPYAAVFRDSLPIAGVDGSLEHRMKGGPAEGRVRAKTGTLRGVNTLAGYATTLRGEERIFAILLNNHTQDSKEGAAALDDIVTAIVTQ